MKLPPDLSGEDLAKARERLGNLVTRQTGSHLRLATNLNGEHHATIHCAPGRCRLSLSSAPASFNAVAG
jgi:predicted RNA binding protein YcfA (HicA-like mRNA interferase family)